MSESQRGGTTGDGGTSRPPVITYIVGIALIIMYIIFVALAWRAVDEAAKVWVHRIGLLGGLETLAFSGAGVILGFTSNGLP